MEEKIKKSRKNQGKIERDKKGRWLPGVSGNPNGKPRGLKSFRTLFKEAVKKLATGQKLLPLKEKIEKKLGKLPSKPETLEEYIVIVGLIKALSGNYNFYKDILDRLYGQAKQIIETEEKKILVLESEEDLEKDWEQKQDDDN